jgi:hypothetical protein
MKPALACLLLAALPLRAWAQTKPLDRIAVFVIYEPVTSPQDVETLRRVRPDLVCRGWFKWASSSNWANLAPFAKACRDLGIVLQGGITVAAVYPGENGMDAATFRDFATIDVVTGQPYRVGGENGWHHLSLYNPKVIAYLKADVRRQIDAGAEGIWYDEIEGYYDWNPTEGYDPYACAAFRDWLIRKYCAGQGWKEDDPRWKSVFGIDLSLYGGSIRNFDYRKHLLTTKGKDGRPLAADPPQGDPRAWASSPNPLYREWGFAWDRRAKGTFRFDTVAALFADLLADANRYAREKYRRKLINTYNHNGTARPGVEFLQPHNGAQPPLINGRLNARVSYLDYYEGTIRDAAEVCPGVPVVFFVDWPGETDRMAAMPRADQVHFFATYIPEAYAAGGEFALPVRGYTYVSREQGTLGYLCKLADFYREHFAWLRGSRPAEGTVDAPEGVAARLRLCDSGAALHLVNHRFDTRDVWPRTVHDVHVSLRWNGLTPAEAIAVSPDFAEQRPVQIRREGDRLTLIVPELTCSALVLLPKEGSLRRVTGRAADGAHLMAVGSRAMAAASDGRFTLWLPPNVKEIECLETGQRLPASGNLVFSAPPDSQPSTLNPQPAFASGLLLDAPGAPMRGAELWVGGRRFHTDTWGRYRIPLPAGASTQVLPPSPPESGTMEPAITIPLRAGFTAWQAVETQRPITAFETGDGGYWGNWPGRDPTTQRPNDPTTFEPVRLSRETRDGKPVLRCEFLPAGAAWCNVNSPRFDTRGMTEIEIVYAGDGTERAISATFQALGGKEAQHFYSISLPLKPTGGTARRFKLSDFRDEQGRAFNPEEPGAAAFQLSPGGSPQAAMTVRLQSARLLTSRTYDLVQMREGAPVQELWRADGEPFDGVDVENLRAGHQPLYGPPPKVAARHPLIRFDRLPEGFLVNWQNKDSGPVLAEGRLVPEGAFLRTTFPPGVSGWANVNFALPLDALRGHDGLIVRLRAVPAGQTVRFSLHVFPPNPGEFYMADVEGRARSVVPADGTDWEEFILPWNVFRADGRPFSFEGLRGLSFQVVRPDDPLKQPVTVDLQGMDLFDTQK